MAESPLQQFEQQPSHTYPSQTVTVRRGGFAIHTDIEDAYHSLKQNNKYRFIILKLDTERWEEMTLEHVGDRWNSWKDFVALLPTNDCRYGIIELDFNNDEKPFSQSRLVFVRWAPESATIKSKMLYAASSALLKNRYPCDLTLQATSAQDVSMDGILDIVSPNNEATLRVPKAPTDLVRNLRQCQTKAVLPDVSISFL